jgi:hypothetical protein
MVVRSVSTRGMAATGVLLLPRADFSTETMKSYRSKRRSDGDSPTYVQCRCYATGPDAGVVATCR